MCLPSSFVLVVGHGLCDFFVLLCFVCSHQHSLIAILWWLLCWLCVRYLGRMVDALACWADEGRVRLR
jgi:hypothetical protein